MPEPVLQALNTWLAAQGFGEVTEARPRGGGCINQAYVLHTASGVTFFLKVNDRAPADMFAREAEGLQALAATRTLKVPEPYLWDATFLLMEDLQPAPARPDYWERFGHGLARMHEHIGPAFGFHHDNYIGSTPQPNPWTQDGYAFYAEHRLLYQARLAHARGLLSAQEVARVERIAQRLPDWVPPQPPSLLHGDLWSGNAMTDREGNPALVDPAAYYGWAEADLAMTALFGGFPERFYRAYLEARPLEPGWRERFSLYNLYHLLNHLNLFGTGYLPDVQAVLRRWTG